MVPVAKNSPIVLEVFIDIFTLSSTHLSIFFGIVAGLDHGTYHGLYNPPLAVGEVAMAFTPEC